MKRGKKMLLYILAIFAVIVICFLLYYNKAFPETQEIANTMEKVGGDYYFNGNSNVGFIIFAGAKADEKAYAYIAKLLYEAGHTAVIPKSVLHMSATASRGMKIIEENPQIEKWFLIGHSLGGLPLSRIAAQKPVKLQGVAFLASYMIMDLSGINISAIRITASNDNVMDENRMEANLEYLPKNSISITMEGTNHKGFGAYNSFSKDGEATLSWKEQQEQTVKLILEFFDAQIKEDKKNEH